VGHVVEEDQLPELEREKAGEEMYRRKELGEVKGNKTKKQYVEL
jgi:hypothetical protein